MRFVFNWITSWENKNRTCTVYKYFQKEQLFPNFDLTDLIGDVAMNMYSFLLCFAVCIIGRTEGKLISLYFSILQFYNCCFLLKDYGV